MRLLSILVCLFGLAITLGVLSVLNARTHRVEAEAFLTMLGDNRTMDAFHTATVGFQKDFPWERFSQFVERFQLTRYQRGSLQIASGFTNYTQRVGLSIAFTGDAALRDGTRFHAQIRMCRENGLWKVDHIYVNFPRLPASVSASASFIPTPYPGASPGSTPFPAGTDAAFNPKRLTLKSPTLKQKADQYLPLAPKPLEPGTERPDAVPSPSPVATPQVQAPGPI